MRTAGLEPLEPYPGSNRPWRCSCVNCGREVAPRYGNVKFRGGRGCRYCGGGVVDPDEAVEVMLAAGLEPLEEYPGADKPWRCRCTRCGSEVRPYYGVVKKGGGGCRVCAGQHVDPVEAAEVMLAAGLEPLEPYPGSHERWQCACLVCGREVASRYHNVRKGYGRCGLCSGAAIDTSEAVEVMRAAGLEPLGDYPGADKPWPSECSRCHRSVSPRFTHVKHRGSGCRYCAGLAINPTEAAEVMLAAGLEPLEKFPGARKGWRSRCTSCGRQVAPHYTTVMRGSRCIFCAGRRVDPEEAAEVMRAAGLEPLEEYPGAAHSWRCRCDRCGNEVTPKYNTIQQGDGGCRFCPPAGFRADEPTRLYLMRHDSFQCLKIGITNRSAKNDRVATHTAEGWAIVATWDSDDGDTMLNAEAAVLHWWRATLGAPAALQRVDMPQGGWTETASLVHVEQSETVAFIADLLSED